MRKTLICLSLVISLLQPLSASASPKAGTKCSTLNKVSGNLICKRVNSKLVWQKNKKEKVVKPNYLPKLVPVFSLRIEGKLLLAQLTVPSSDNLANDSIQEAQVFYYVNKEQNQVLITSGKSNLRNETGSFAKTVTFRMDTAGNWDGVEITVGIKFVNPYGAGPESKQAIKILPSPPKSTDDAEGGCQVLSPAALPFGNQRITVTNVVWEKDQSGYVSALFTIRNDNSISLRLVQFKFYVFSGNSIINLAQTLQGDNFFIKDDNKFNGVDGQTGAWLPGQSRTFRLPTNEILDCGSIRYSSGAFTVLQGIGDN